MGRAALSGWVAWTCATLLAGCGAPSVEQLTLEGISEFQLGRIDRAESRLAEALQRKPFHADALFYMGRVHQAQNRYDRAAYYYACCLDAAPGYPLGQEYLTRARQQAAPPAPKPAPAESGQ